VSTESLVGRTYPPVETVIEGPRVAAFAASLGADAGAGVPPTFAAVYALGATVPQLFADEDAAIDVAHLLHAEQEFEWERHPQVGETVTARGEIVSDVVRRGIRLLGFETRCTVGGEPLCRSRATFLVRAGG
jgi:hypothetical protein